MKAKRLFLELAIRGGVFALARLLTSSHPRILMYHRFCSDLDDDPGRVPTSLFRAQLEYLRRHFEPVRLRDLGLALAEKRDLPPRAVVITVDDGYRDFFECAFPLLREFDFPATFFVPTQFISGQDWLWYDKFDYLLKRAPSLAGFDSARRAALLVELKGLCTQDRNRQIADLAAETGTTIPHDAPPESEPVFGDELMAMIDSGLVDVGAHTRTHPILAHDSLDEAKNEIVGSRSDLAERTRILPETFCYPNGLAGDYTPAQVDVVEDAGYLCAAASCFGLIHQSSNRFELPRMGVDRTPFTVFRKYVDGVEYLQRRFSGALGRS